MSRSSGGAKPLSGGSSLTARNLPGLEDIIIGTLTSGTGFIFNNIVISGGTIDGVIIGDSLPGIGIFTTLQAGRPDGTGGPVCFYGNTVGDYACWVTSGIWDIGGDLKVRDISDLGNLRVSVNTISATNTGGGISLASNGTGIVNITGGGLTQSTSIGNINLSAINGSYILSSRTYTTNTTLNNKVSTTDGAVSFTTGLSQVTYPISFITTGTNPTITTTSTHNLTIGDKVILSGTNSTPVINGVYTVLTTPTTTTFTINTSPAITVAGTNGSLVKRNDINLNALDSVFIPTNTPLEFGNNLNYIYENSDNLNLIANNDITLSPVNNINIPTNKLLTFSDDLKNITSNGTDLIINSDTQVVINSDLTVNGEMTYLKTTVTALDDPVITLGGTEPPTVSDIKDRGVEIRYYDGIAKIGYFGKSTSTGCFTWIPDATNTNEVFTGTPGCARFGALTITSLDLSGGNITNLGTLNACDIQCSGDMIITGTSSITLTTSLLTLNGDSLIINDSLPLLGITSISDTKDKGFTFNYYDGSPKIGFFGWDNSTDCFKFLKDVTVVDDEVTAGTDGDVCFGNTQVNNLTVNGSLVGGSLPERFSTTGGGVANPTILFETTFITVTTAGIATGTLPPHVIDGGFKKVFLVSAVAGASYELSCPLGRLIDPGSGTAAAKTLKFEYPGQSIDLVWDNVVGSYFFVNAGVCIV